MSTLIARQIVALDGVSESGGLAKAEADAFAGDGVNAAGSIADEGNIAANDAAQRMHRSHRATLDADRLGISDSRAKLGKVAKRRLHAKTAVVRDNRDTDFGRAEGRDV